MGAAFAHLKESNVLSQYIKADVAPLTLEELQDNLKTLALVQQEMLQQLSDKNVRKHADMVEHMQVTIPGKE